MQCIPMMHQILWAAKVLPSTCQNNFRHIEIFSLCFLKLSECQHLIFGSFLLLGLIDYLGLKLLPLTLPPVGLLFIVSFQNAGGLSESNPWPQKRFKTLWFHLIFQLRPS